MTPIRRPHVRMRAAAWRYSDPMVRWVVAPLVVLVGCGSRSATPAPASSAAAPGAAVARRGPCLSLAECRADCGTGEPCARLAEFHLHGWAGVVEDEAQGRALLEGACRAHHVPACQRLVSELDDGSPERAAAQRLLMAEAEAGCASDDAVACGALASERRDRATVERACIVGDVDACGQLLQKPLAGDFEDLAPWHRRFAALARARCEAGDAVMCFREASRLRLLDRAAAGDPELAAQIRDVTSDDPRDAATYLRAAVDLWETQCSGGWPAACWEAAGSLADGVWRDDARSRSFGRRACALGVEPWCDPTP